MKFVLILPLLFVVCLLRGQDAVKKGVERRGIVFGTALGVSRVQRSGSVLQRDIQAGLSFPNFKIGGMLGRRTALLLYLPGSVYNYQGEGRRRDRGFEGMFPSVQFWPRERWWVLGGAGLAMDAPAFYDIQDAGERKFYFGAGMVAGAGYEIWRGRRSALDIQTRVHYGSVDRPEGAMNGWALNLLLGFNWY